MANIRIQNITEASREKWLSTAKACPYATYFHTPYWYDIIAPNQNHTALEITFDDGASAIIPIAKIKRAGGLLVDNFSSPGGTYGGWVSTSPLNEEHVKILANLLVSKKNLTFRINPFDNSAAWLKVDGFTQDYTYALDLTLGENELYSRSNRGHKEKLRKAVRNGISVRQAQSWQECEQYYALYLESVDRWVSRELKPRAVYPLEFFRRLYDGKTEREILWLALKGEEVIAGMLCFYWNKHAVGWHASASARHFVHGPNNLLYWEIIIDAARRGFEIFDCNPSGGYGGVESFKEHLGAVKTPAPVLYTKTPLRLLITRLRGCFKT
ncbi:MAG: GNAT family N-acetyltransferase [Chitinispirillales bacterium]|jgi:hypothetical protein|nr:GNAT family N-acetyltransferase [Chitinispirillales bacterium]